MKGLEATLECEVTGTPPFEVKWLKNNKEMFSSKKYAISTKESVFTLHVTNCDVSDVGEYQCIISNEGGSCSCSTRLSLKGQSSRKHTPNVTSPSKTVVTRMTLCDLSFPSCLSMTSLPNNKQNLKPQNRHPSSRSWRTSLAF